MESSSIVSRARTAFNSAAAKAEKVFTDIKKSDVTADQDSDEKSRRNSIADCQNIDQESKNRHDVKHLRWRPSPLKAKQDWHERLKNIRIGKKGVEDTEKAKNATMSFAIFDENLCVARERNTPQSLGSKLGSLGQGPNATSSNVMAPSAVIKQLAIAIEVSKKSKSMKDLLASSQDSSPIRERAGLSFSAMKSLVLREKEEKVASEFGTDEKVVSLINSLLDSEGQTRGAKTCLGSEETSNITSLLKDIHGAPHESFVVKLAEVIGSLKTRKKMASFWCRVLAELRRLWSEGRYIPGISQDDIPDLNSCLLHQRLQVINCCISRKKRRLVATESLDFVASLSTSNIENSAASDGTVPAKSGLYTRTSTGELVPRLGADKVSESLMMLETGEPVYAPVMQEGPLLTEDLIKETEELVLRTGSVGAGCSQLLSDMQAFKAANPCCILEDFVRWHSPPDWTETDANDEAKESLDAGDLSSTKGQLSRRMQKEGNLWRELWETAKPVPAVLQSPLFDEDLAVEGILNILEDIPPSELFEQLFISLLGSGFVAAEDSLSANSSLSRLFCECKDYIIATCQGSPWFEKIDDICQVYDTVETMVLKPDEVLKLTNQPEESASAGEAGNQFTKLSFIFGGKDKRLGKPPSKDQKNLENTTRHPFSSIFLKKPPKIEDTSPAASPADKSVCSIENDWTVV